MLVHRISSTDVFLTDTGKKVGDKHKVCWCWTEDSGDDSTLSTSILVVTEETMK